MKPATIVQLAYRTHRVASIRDWTHNVTVNVRWNSWRYFVTLTDNDSGNTLPVARTFGDRLSAIQYAVSIVGGDA